MRHPSCPPPPAQRYGRHGQGGKPGAGPADQALGRTQLFDSAGGADTMSEPRVDGAQPPDHPTGYDLLRNPRLNKGTAFTAAERRAYGLEGLLPPAVLPLALQVARRHEEIASLPDDLLKYLVLSDLQARNET